MDNRTINRGATHAKEQYVKYWAGGRMGGTFNHERIIPADEAVERLFAYAERNGFRIECVKQGTINNTVTCRLLAPQGRSFLGRGKGVGAQTLASAIAEAFEHYYHRCEDLGSKDTRPSFEFDHPDLKDSSPDFDLLFKDSPLPLRSIKFDGIATSWNPIYFPAVLMNAHYVATNEEEKELIKRSRIYRYSTNSGTAAGLSREEALLHGLLEIVERDAMGLAFVKHVLSRPARPARVLRLETLPLICRQLIEAVTSETGGELKLWDISTDVQIPCTLCAVALGISPTNRFFGSGCSLNPAYAVERAILEALQGYHIQFKFGEAFQGPMNRDRSRMSLFQKCQLSSGYFEYTGGEVPIEFGSLPVLSASSAALREQIRVAREALECAGIKCYFRIIHGDELCVAQVVAPKLERLYLLHNGISVAPGWRGRSARHMSQEPRVS